MLACISYAEELELLYEGLAPYGEKFSSNGDIFFISGQSDLEQFVVNLPTGNILSISGTGCYSKDGFIVCYNGTKELDWVNYSIDKEYWKAYINISKYSMGERGIIITKLYDYEPPLLIQDPFIITLKLFNNATSAAKGIILKDLLPEGIRVTYADGCEYFGRNIRWYGNLNSGVSHICTYTIEAITNVTYSTAATANYILDDIEKTAVSNLANISFSVPLLKLEPHISNNTLKVGDIVFYQINMTNLDEEQDMSINRMRVNVPENIMILQYHPKFREESYGLSFKGILDKSETLDIWFSGSVMSEGNHSINTTIDYIIRGVFTQTSLSEPISVDYYGDIPVNVSIDNISNLTNISINVSDNLTFIENVSLNDTAAEVNNIAVITPPVSPPITHVVPEKKAISGPVIIGIVIMLIIVIGVFVFIKKRKESYY